MDRGVRQARELEETVLSTPDEVHVDPQHLEKERNRLLQEISTTLSSIKKNMHLLLEKPEDDVG